jgi:hypothetical protein
MAELIDKIVSDEREGYPPNLFLGTQLSGLMLQSHVRR